jgi:hypothetical protein
MKSSHSDGGASVAGASVVVSFIGNQGNEGRILAVRRAASLLTYCQGGAAETLASLQGMA